MERATYLKRTSPALYLSMLSASVMAVGACAVLVAAVVQAGVPDRSWLIMVGLAMLSAPLSTVYIPGVKAKVALGDMVTLACAALFGPAAAIIAGAVDAATTSLLITKNPRKFAYNVASNALSMAGAVAVARVAYPLFGVETARLPLSELVAAIALLTSVYFAMSTGLIAAYLAIQKGVPLLKMWADNFLWTSISYIASGLSTFAIVLLMGRLGYYVFPAVAVVMVLVFLFYRVQNGKVESANKRADLSEEMGLHAMEALVGGIGAVGYAVKVDLRRAEHLALELGRAAGCSDAELKALRVAVRLHDIGNIALPQDLLEKPGPLAEKELDLVRSHVAVGARMVQSMGFPQGVAEIVRLHHERWDGTGYPDGLRGERIPLPARVLAIVDCYNALTVDRPYRKKVGRDAALSVIGPLSGTTFDPRLMQKFLEIVARADEEAHRVQSEATGFEELQSELLRRKSIWRARLEGAVT